MSGFYPCAAQDGAATPPSEDLPQIVWVQVVDANGRSTYSIVTSRKQVSRARDVWIQIDDGAIRATVQVGATQPVPSAEADAAKYIPAITAASAMQPRLNALSLVKRDETLRKSVAEIHGEAKALYVTNRVVHDALLELARLRVRDP